MNNKHPHINAINNLDDIGSLIDIIEKSKNSYVKDNLSIHLHDRQLTLLRDIKKHNKPHHKKIRISKYKKLMENPETQPEHYELHKKLFLKHYQKLESKGLITLDTHPENGLPYDMEFTQKGLDILDEISKLEKEWEEKILENVDDKEELLKLLRIVAVNSLDISYEIQKKLRGVY